MNIIAEVKKKFILSTNWNRKVRIQIEVWSHILMVQEDIRRKKKKK